jgi:hypothetical protein
MEAQLLVADISSIGALSLHSRVCIVMCRLHIGLESSVTRYENSCSLSPEADPTNWAVANSDLKAGVLISKSYLCRTILTFTCGS